MPDGGAERVAEDAEERKVGRHVNAGEEVGEGVVEEEVALEHDLWAELHVDDVRDEQGYLAEEEEEHYAHEHERDAAVEFAGRVAELPLAPLDLGELARDEGVDEDEDGQGYDEDEGNVEPDVEELLEEGVVAESGVHGDVVADLVGGRASRILLWPEMVNHVKNG